MEKWQRLLVILSVFLLLIVLMGLAIRIALAIQHTLILFSLGILVAYALDPMVEWLRNTSVGKTSKRPSRELSVGAVVVLIAGLVGLGLWSLEGRVVYEFGVLQHGWPVYHNRLMIRAAELDQRLLRAGIHFSLSGMLHHPPKDLADEGGRIGRQVLPVVGGFFKSVGESVIVLLIAIYCLLYSADLREKFNGMIPEMIRERVSLWQTDVNRILGGFVRGQLLIALAMGLAAAIGCLIVGIKVWLIIGLFVVAASLIPVFGPYIGAIPAVLAAIASPTHFGNPAAAAVFILLWFVVINEVGSKILYPKLVGAALGLHAMVVLFVLFAGLEIGGVIGVLFAAPLTALGIVTVVHLFRWWQDLPDSLLSEAAARSVPHRPANTEPTNAKSQPTRTEVG